MYKQLGVLVLFVLGIWILFPSYAEPQEVLKSSPISDEDFLFIESLDIAAPIRVPSSNREIDIQLALQDGVAHLLNTAKIGEVGNAYIVGHSSDYFFALGNYKNVFAKLPQIKIDDQIRVTSDGRELIFKVIKTSIVSPNDISVLSQNTNNLRLITLQTSYPIGTSKLRFLAVAKLIED